MPPSVVNKALAYLGSKLDQLIAVSKTQKIDLNLGESTKQLESATKQLALVAQSIQKNEIARDFSDIRTDLKRLVLQVQDSASAIKQAASKLDTSHGKKTNELLAQTLKAVSHIKLEEQYID